MKTLVSLALLLVVAGCAPGSKRITSSQAVRTGPANGVVRIEGEITRPGVYPYTPGMAIKDLVQKAEGLTDFASGISVERGGTNLVDAYLGNHNPTRKSQYMNKYMNMLLGVGDVVRIHRMRF